VWREIIEIGEMGDGDFVIPKTTQQFVGSPEKSGSGKKGGKRPKNFRTKAPWGNLGRCGIHPLQRKNSEGREGIDGPRKQRESVAGQAPSFGENGASFTLTTKGGKSNFAQKRKTGHLEC